MSLITTLIGLKVLWKYWKNSLESRLEILIKIQVLLEYILKCGSSVRKYPWKTFLLDWESFKMLKKFPYSFEKILGKYSKKIEYFFQKMSQDFVVFGEIFLKSKTKVPIVLWKGHLKLVMEIQIVLWNFEFFPWKYFLKLGSPLGKYP